MTEPENGWSAVIDHERCIGSGLCVTYAPGTFEQNEDARAVLRTPSTDSLDEIRAAVEACPTGAIALTVHERNGSDET
jgi:ferredoxin